MTTKGFSFTLRTTDRKTLDITVKATREVIVRGPHDTTDEQAIALVRRRRAWIYGQLRHLEQNAPENPVKELVNGSGFVVLGRGHRLRIVPDDAQDQPVVQHLHTGSGSWLHMRRTTADNASTARRALVDFYARAGQGWVERNAPSILTRTATPEMAVRMSTRMRTTWAYRHPTRGLTLHWATAQLSSNFLHELVHRALGLPSVAHKQLYEQAFRSLWLGDLGGQPPTLRA
ncbi:YgjP-like metallopeptidase domain-containing protein [Streptomyces sp. L500]